MNDRTRRYSLKSRLLVAALTAILLTPAQFGVFQCSGLPLLSVGTGIPVFGGVPFAILSFLSRAWWSGAVALFLAAASLPVLFLSHVCG